jgi:DNA-binding transcriptional LysR family regulator
MELRHIRYFLEVAETLNFSRAAERLHVAQPALSKQIRDLEEELGGRLFHRTTTKVSLTEMGHYFRQQTRKLVMQLDIAVTGAQQMSRGASGTLRVGCDWRTNNSRLPIAAAARRFRELNPRLSVQFVEIPSHEHVNAVRDHSIDLGFSASIFLGATDDLELRRLCAIRMKVLLPKGHRLETRPKVTLRELKNERWLALDSESVPAYRVLMAQVLQYTPKYGLTTTSLPGLVAHVTAGHGIGLVPEGGAGADDDGVVAIDTDCTPMEVFAVFTREGASPLLPAYLDVLEGLMKKQGGSLRSR